MTLRLPRPPASPRVLVCRKTPNTATPVATAPGRHRRPRYDVVLAIDVMEDTGSRKHKGLIAQMLADVGVKTVVRRLHLGDFLWLAKERVR